MLVPIDLDAEFARLTEHWSPRVVGRVNDQYVKIAKLQGEFVWHAHAEEDELFLVIRGRLVIQLEDGEVTPGLASVAAAVLDHNVLPAAGVAVTFAAGDPDGLALQVRRVADALTARLA